VTSANKEKHAMVSARRRWRCCDNATRNDPYRDSRHPRYTQLAKVEDAAILDAAARRLAGAGDVGWLA
jgi:hypothetical protein